MFLIRNFHICLAIDSHQELRSVEPCNDFPEYCDLPIDWSLWLGAGGSGSSTLEEILTLKNGEWIASGEGTASFARTQTRSATSMLNDGTQNLLIKLPYV
jgi:hypothetical protein